MRKAKGTWNGNKSDTREIAIMFDLVLFNRISDEAHRAGISFSEQVRRYIEKGMQR